MTPSPFDQRSGWQPICGRQKGDRRLMPELQFLEVDFLKPTVKNPKSRAEDDQAAERPQGQLAQ